MIEWRRFLRRDAGRGADRAPGDARPVVEHLRRHAFDPEIGRHRKLRRRGLILALTGICLAGSAAAVVGEGGWVDLLRLRREISVLKAEIAQSEAAVARLADEVQRLEHDPMALERVARGQLGMVRPGEIDFLLPREDDRQWDDAPAAPRAVDVRP